MRCFLSFSGRRGGGSWASREGLAALLIPSTTLRALAAALLILLAVEADVFEEWLAAGLSCLTSRTVALLRIAPRGGSGPAGAVLFLLGRPTRSAPPALVAPALLYELGEGALGGRLRPRAVVPGLRSGLATAALVALLATPASQPVTMVPRAGGAGDSSSSVYV